MSAILGHQVGIAWWPSHGSPGPTPTMTLTRIKMLRRWAANALGASASALVIERIGERNRVTLRFFVQNSVCECDVARLHALHRLHLSAGAARAAVWTACFGVSEALGVGLEVSSGRG